MVDELSSTERINEMFWFKYSLYSLADFKNKSLKIITTDIILVHIQFNRFYTYLNLGNQVLGRSLRIFSSTSEHYYVYVINKIELKLC